MAVESTCNIVGLGSEFDPSDIFHSDNRAIPVSADHDVGKLVLGDETTRSPNSEGHLLTRRYWFGTGLSGGIHRVLLVDGFVDLLRGDIEIGQFGWIKPEAHRIGACTEDSNTRNAGESRQRIDDVDVGVVGQEDRVIAIIVSVEGKADQW